MNEFTAKKLGEVLAFCQVGAETMEKGKQAFASALSDQDIDALVTTLSEQAQKIESLTENKDVTMTKAEATGKKLRAMRDLYVGDEWDNPAELMEWSGFFEGAAVVHWDLVIGASEVLNNEELKDLAMTGRAFHHDLFHAASGALKVIGRTKAAQ